MKYSRMPVVYIAGPYRAVTAQGVELHIQAARHVGLLACRKGWAPIIPHSNTSHMDLCAPDLGDEFWLASTMETMRRCDAVCLVPGWERSSGTMAEIEEANRLGIPVFSPDTLPAAGQFLASLLFEHKHNSGGARGRLTAPDLQAAQGFQPPVAYEQDDPELTELAPGTVERVMALRDQAMRREQERLRPELTTAHPPCAAHARASDALEEGKAS